MLIIPSCVKWLLWMLKSSNKTSLNLILGFGFSKGLLNLNINNCVKRNQLCKGLG
jgi:hypothetical protein